MDLDKLRVFYLVVAEGSMYRAAKKLNLAPSALSRTISVLEESVQTKLFIREKAKSLVLSDAGKILFEHTKEILRIAATAEETVKDVDKTPKGNLKVISTAGIISNWIIHFVPGFLRKYPDMRLTLYGSSSESLTNSNADAAINPFEESNEDLVQIYLRSVKYKIFASKEYLREFGEPKTPQDLDNHRLIVYSLDSPKNLQTADWLLSFGANPEKPRTPYLQVNTTDGVIKAVNYGLGIGAIIDELIDIQYPNVVQILPDIGTREEKYYYTFRRHLQYSKRVTAFCDYILDEIKKR
ncbi:LysR family transcriptional regulator [Candidatus Nucleicultrix amoebiphila]|jgi:DNA-binding transcriptional LysR family regulator|uniref:HTH lysR-type domain-containing protein n=1 Tax=Candidatus Nucleicultrix amoebiphila FS5 TaxID=1414854 RepID=A0A1W6N6F0_9PROT|nr:LysR family transcriptional regulator [Candidatus Nucleicultrix amoebiphila]ARN85423.1 hypothetical protein GQ61_09145 [Candidatus Nucleicultrix amoebiphila FS5]